MVNHPAIILWLVNSMMLWSPLGKPRWHESKAEDIDHAKSRYEASAKAAFQTVYDPNVKPIFDFPAKNARAESAILLLWIANKESNFSEVVQYHTGTWHGFADNGNSFCFMQIKLPRYADDKGNIFRKTTREGYTWEQLIGEDPERCFRAGYRIVKSSLNSCRHLENFNDRLSQYATGHCEANNKKSRARLEPAIDWFWSHLPPVDDAEVMEFIQKNSESI